MAKERSRRVKVQLRRITKGCSESDTLLMLHNIDKMAPTVSRPRDIVKRLNCTRHASGGALLVHLLWVEAAHWYILQPLFSRLSKGSAAGTLRFWNATAPCSAYNTSVSWKSVTLFTSLFYRPLTGSSFLFKEIFSCSMVQRLGESSVDVLQALEVAISLCLCIYCDCAHHSP